MPTASPGYAPSFSLQSNPVIPLRRLTDRNIREGRAAVRCPCRCDPPRHVTQNRPSSESQGQATISRKDVGSPADMSFDWIGFWRRLNDG